MELSLQEYLRRGIVGNYNKDTAVKYIGDVQFYWCCVMCTVTEECAQKLLKLLLVTICGFALAAAYMEEYIQNKQGEDHPKKA